MEKRMKLTLVEVNGHVFFSRLPADYEGKVKLTHGEYRNLLKGVEPYPQSTMMARFSSL
jgi:hypothetical protein